MNSTIAQLVVLACFGNATLRARAAVPRVFPENSTCRFCERVAFVAMGESFFGAPRIKSVAATPDKWFAHLQRHHASRIRLTWAPRNDPRIADHQSAAFAGGGGDWALAVSFAESSQVWRSRWEVFDRNAPEQRIWRVTYGPPVDAPHSGADAAADALEPGALRVALTQILAFSQTHETGGFSASFRAALDALDGIATEPATYADLYPPGALPSAAGAVLAAAQKAWVFGGMGSWNDMSFDGDAAMDYARVSAQLYAALTRSICAATNQSAA
ncbi:MAG: hypothetical protein ABI846_12205 [Rudaea sp.]